MKAKEEELRKVFQTTVSLCVNNGLMTAERAQSYHRSGEVHVGVCGFLLGVEVSHDVCSRLLLSSPRRRPAIRSG